MTTVDALENSYSVINGATGRLETRQYDMARFAPVVHLQMWEKLGYSYVPRPGGETYAPVSSLLSLLDVLPGKRGTNKSTPVAQAVEVAQLRQELAEANSELARLTERMDEMERAQNEAEERQRRSLAVLTT